MTDSLTPAQRSVNMAKIRSSNTKPEMVVRRMLYAAGFRYRLHRKDMPGKPDLVFAGRRKVVFVHGCFWHQHDHDACLDGRRPKSNTDYWNEKLDRNVERDESNRAKLAASGWDVMVVWECETTNPAELLPRLVSFLRAG